MNKIEYISCLLGKIANDIKGLDKSNLESDIKQLKKHTIFPLKFPDKHLFVQDINEQKEFYDLLKRLHRSLLYKLRTGSLEEVKYEDIKKLGCHIFMDSKEKVTILKKIIDDYSEDFPSQLKMLEKNLAHKYSKVSLVTLLLVLFSYFVFRTYALDPSVYRG
jgi:hypothetical protein